MIAVALEQIYGKGAEGIYFKLSDFRGVKSYTSRRHDIDREFLTHKRAFEIAPQIICKPFKIVKLDYFGKIYEGLLMRHLEGPTLLKAVNSDLITFKHGQTILKEVESKLLSSGIMHLDLFPRNVVLSSQGPKIIDLDPKFIKFL